MESEFGDMEDCEFLAALIVVAVLLCIGGFVGAAIQDARGDDYWKRRIVAHGAAHYDTQTGEWKWNEPAQ